MTSAPAAPTGHCGSGEAIRRLSVSEDASDRPLISLVVPAYNEALILEQNLSQLCEHMAQLSHEFRWEAIIVNDGSRDETAVLADAFAAAVPEVHVVHHRRNGGLGQALRTGFKAAKGDYVVTLDLDLSYAPDHIERLVRRMRDSGAKVVVASPYMTGGKASNVPPFRLFLSVWANRFLSLMAKRDVATLTGMVRAYDGEFVRSLHPRAQGMDINPEILHKAKLLNARVDEIPAHLHWLTPAATASRAQSNHRSGKNRRHSQRPTPEQKKPAQKRSSSMKILRHMWSIFFYGFVFRPAMFFFFPSLLCLGLGAYSGVWSVIHSWTSYRFLAQASGGVVDPTKAVALAFQQQPHTFIIGGMLLMLGVQLLSLAVLSAQSKYYFEEIFHLGTSIHQSHQPPDAKDNPSQVSA